MREFIFAISRAIFRNPMKSRRQFGPPPGCKVRVKQLQKAKAGDRGVRVFPSLAQRVQIHVAKLRQDDRVLKFSDRRIASAREDDNTCMLLRNGARST
jgi:hypothetical protein